jgi:DNA-binding transcriptional MocR family regulator
MTTIDTPRRISGTTAAEIAGSIRALVEQGVFPPGEALPSVRDLARALGVNRNTVVAAYRQLAQAAVVISRGRGGTRVAERAPLPQEGFARDTVLRDVGTGNPDPALIPDLAPILGRIASRPVLYGEPVVDEDLAAWAHDWFAPDLLPRDVHVTVTNGAVDALERLLAQALTRDDAVALEDPCFLSAIHTVRVGGYRPVAVPVDEEGMTVAGLQAALDAGVRAIVCTPRAQNPTGAGMSAERASALREVLAEHPFVLIVEDDHFSLLSRHPYRSLISPAHRRWALVRSVSKFLGPDMCLALAATDPETATRLATRLSPGTTWVSHLLQRLALAQLTDPAARGMIARASAHYSERNRAVAALFTDQGVDAVAHDGLNLWVDTGASARAVSEQLMRRGWLARTGDQFALRADQPSRHLRLTVHDLDDSLAASLARDLSAAVRAAALTEG